MSEDTSLTDAVKLAAGISLTKAVKDVAGRRTWFVDEVLDARDDAAPGAVTPRAPRLVAACARLAAFAVLTLAFLHATRHRPSSMRNADRLRPCTGASRSSSAIPPISYTPRLENPKNDAADMGAALKKLGFQVIEGFDLDKEAFDAKVRDFAEALKGASVGVFFYAGHGMQVSGQNYLVPVDAKLAAVSALNVEMVRLDLVHQTMEREAQTNLLFFDACRDNPLVRNLARAVGSRSPRLDAGLPPSKAVRAR